MPMFAHQSMDRIGKLVRGRLAANNLSDLASASSARANLGLGTAAQLASSALFQVANNLSEVASAATALIGTLMTWLVPHGGTA